MLESYDVTAFERIHAYGDTDEDRELLALAHHAHYRRMPGDALPITCSG